MEKAERSLVSRVKENMIAYYSGDSKRIHHFLKVHTFAKLIGEMEGMTGKPLEILEVAALVHDIGIKIQNGNMVIIQEKHRSRKDRQKQKKCF